MLFLSSMDSVSRTGVLIFGTEGTLVCIGDTFERFRILDELKDALSTPSLLPLPLFKHFLTKIFFTSTSGIEADTWLL